MAFEVVNLTVNLLKDQAIVAVQDRESGTHVHVTVSIETPGNQPENRLKEISKEAAKKALQGAIDAL